MGLRSLAGVVGVLLVGMLVVPRAHAAFRHDTLQAPEPVYRGYFGGRIAASKETVAVASVEFGWPWHSTSTSLRFYEPEPGGAPRLVQSLSFASVGLGDLLSVDGDLALVSSRSACVDQDDRAGYAYVLRRDAATRRWDVEGVLPRAADEPCWQEAVALSGRFAFVANPIEMSDADVYGVVRVYERRGAPGRWELVQTLAPPFLEFVELFGTAIAIDEGTAVVGAPYHDGGTTYGGTAYVYERDEASGRWNFVQRLIPSDLAAFDECGYSVDVLGDRAVLGCPYGHGEPGVEAGAAYTFARDPVTRRWTQTRKLSAADGAVGDRFGWSVALSESHVLVGAPWRDAGETNAGAAYLYGHDPSLDDWELLATYATQHGVPRGQFGGSVALGGAHAWVGAPVHSGEATYAGGVLVVDTGSDDGGQAPCNGHGHVALSGRCDCADGFAGEACDGSLVGFGDYPACRPDNELPAPGSSAVHGAFGVGVATDGERVFVSQWSYAKSGRVHEFRREDGSDGWVLRESHLPSRWFSMLEGAISASASDWLVGLRSGEGQVFGADASSPQTLTAPDSICGASFHQTVVVRGDLAVVGCAISSSRRTDGEVQIFQRDPADGQWSWSAMLTPSDAMPGGAFGEGVALDGDVLVVGVPGQHADGQDAVGAAYVYERELATGRWRERQKLVPPDGGRLQSYAGTVAVAGDTIAIADSDAPGGGAVYLYRRSDGGDAWEHRQTLRGKLVDFGAALAMSADALLVGAPGTPSGGADEAGAALLYLRDPRTGSWVENRRFAPPGAPWRARFGKHVSLAGRLAVIGAPGLKLPSGDLGAAYVYELQRSCEDRTFCQGRGQCAEDGVCRCDVGWSGANCGGRVHPVVASCRGDADCAPDYPVAFHLPAEQAAFDACAVRVCLGGRCRFAPVSDRPDCCVSADAELGLGCDDRDPRTSDSCEARPDDYPICRHDAPEPPVGCLTHAACIDGSACTVDWCCAGPGDPVAGCLAAGDCVSEPIASPSGCCETRADCNGVDKPPEMFCRQGYCVGGACRYAPPSDPTCCVSAEDCPAAECQAPACVENTCALVSIPDCCMTATDCPPSGGDCVMMTCSNGRCVAKALPGCCVDDNPIGPDASCDDGNPCTADFCVPAGARWEQCRHFRAGSAGCCVADDECPDDGVKCTEVSCGEGNACRLTPEESCLVYPPYEMTFSEGHSVYLGQYTSLPDIGWSVADASYESPMDLSVWHLESGEDPHLRLDPEAGIDNFDTCVVLPQIYNGRGDELRFRYTAEVRGPGVSMELRTSAHGGWRSASRWGLPIVLDESIEDAVYDSRQDASSDEGLSSQRDFLAICVRGTSSDALVYLAIDDVQLVPRQSRD